MMIYFGRSQIYVGLAALALSLIILWKRNKSLSYLFFFSIFWIYLMGVVSVVIFPFPMDIPNPDFKPSINLIPFYFGSCFDYLPALCFRGIYENILLTIPLGFGISFILSLKQKHIFWLALAVGLTFETVQLIISLAFKTAFRSVDINDVILNAVGVLLGYGLFRIFGAVYSFIIHKIQIQPRYIFAYVYDIVRPQS